MTRGREMWKYYRTPMTPRKPMTPLGVVMLFTLSILALALIANVVSLYLQGQ